MPRGSNHQPTCYSPRPQVLVLVTRPELVVGPACSQQTVTNKRQVVTLQMMFFDLCPCERIPATTNASATTAATVTTTITGCVLLQ